MQAGDAGHSWAQLQQFISLKHERIPPERELRGKTQVLFIGLNTDAHTHTHTHLHIRWEQGRQEARCFPRLILTSDCVCEMDALRTSMCDTSSFISRCSLLVSVDSGRQVASQCEAILTHKLARRPTQVVKHHHALM